MPKFLARLEVEEKHAASDPREARPQSVSLVSEVSESNTNLRAAIFATPIGEKSCTRFFGLTTSFLIFWKKNRGFALILTYNLFLDNEMRQCRPAPLGAHRGKQAALSDPATAAAKQASCANCQKA